MQRIEIPLATRPITEEEELALGFPQKKGMLDLDIYTIEQVAYRLDLTEATIRTHIKKGKLKAIRIGGPSGYRILRNHIYEWLITMQTELHNQPKLRKPYTRKNVADGGG